ncbi:MAG: epoxyqueuosine reductase QueH [Clostridiales bacterium]|nr:epoxyqueuosine reductase QueH [Clostridiales bacterium]
MNQNYQKELDRLLDNLQREGRTPRLLLHSCCAPCSSYVLEYLSQYFSITVLYYNPNIFPQAEFETRIREQERLIAAMPLAHPVSFIAGAYDSEKFYAIAKGLEQEPEGGERCFRCYELRLREAARCAKAGGFDFFTTTLTISPLKNAAKLNEIGQRLGEELGVAWLPSDFKKRNGYRRSTELSKEYGLYRQDYCGCVYSKQERDRRVARRQEEGQ